MNVWIVFRVTPFTFGKQPVAVYREEDKLLALELAAGEATLKAEEWKVFDPAGEADLP